MLTFRSMLIASLSLMLSSAVASACPFCSAVSQTFSEEIASMDVAVICELKSAAIFRAELNQNPQAEVPKSTFIVTKVIRGEEYVKQGDTFRCVYFGEAKKERSFLAMATEAPNLAWTTPLILTDRAQDYLIRLTQMNASKDAQQLSDLKAKRRQIHSTVASGKVGSSSLREDEAFQENPALAEINKQIEELEAKISVDRLEFFQMHLEDQDEMLARDAYDEFANAPYDAVKRLAPKIDHEKLIAFLNNPEVPSNRRRLYFTMLGVCGTDDDAKMLEEFMVSGDRKKKAGLDALIACYLLLNPEEGLEKVEELFFKDQDVEYADTYAAIMAIRFHGSEVEVLPRQRLTRSLRYMLDRPDLADLVIPDLAKWEDWSVMGKLVDLFVTADENSSWVRVPVVNYLRACPLPIAKEKIEFLKTVDAEAVKRAMTFFPVAADGDDKAPISEDAAEAKREPAAKTTSSLDSKPSYRVTESKVSVAQIRSERSDKKNVLPSSGRKNSDSLVRISPPDTLNQVETIAEQGPNFWKLFGVMMVSVAVCFLAMRNALGFST